MIPDFGFRNIFLKDPLFPRITAGILTGSFLIVATATADSGVQKQQNTQLLANDRVEQPICKVGGTVPEGWYVFAEGDADKWRMSCPRPATLDDPHYNAWRTTPAIGDVGHACRDTPLPKDYSIIEKLFRGDCPSAGMTVLGEPVPNAYTLQRQTPVSPQETFPPDTDRHSDVGTSEEVPAPVTSSQDAFQHAAQGNEYFARLRYAEAEAEFRTAESLDPSSADWPALVALTLVLQGKYDEAETEAQVAVRLDQKNAVAHAALAAALSSLGKWKDAEVESRVGMRLDPAGARGIPGLSQFLFGLSLWRLGKKHEAEQTLREVVQKFDRYQGKLAQVLFEDGRLDEAEAQYREALRLHPGDQFLTRGLEEVVRARE
jgi:Flp pilus assembly protein TadD